MVIKNKLSGFVCQQSQHTFFMIHQVSSFQIYLAYSALQWVQCTCYVSCHDFTSRLKLLSDFVLLIFNVIISFICKFCAFKFLIDSFISLFLQIKMLFQMIIHSPMLSTSLSIFGCIRLFQRTLDFD